MSYSVIQSITASYRLSLIFIHRFRGYQFLKIHPIHARVSVTPILVGEKREDGIWSGRSTEPLHLTQRVFKKSLVLMTWPVPRIFIKVNIEMMKKSILNSSYFVTLLDLTFKIGGWLCIMQCSKNACFQYIQCKRFI